MTTQNSTTDTQIRPHPFEAAGLGRAPFGYVGMETKIIAETGQPAGSCAYCGNGIKYVFFVQSADGKCFGVGCDCIMKLNRADNAIFTDSDMKRVMRAERDAKNKVAADRRAAKRAAEYNSFITLLDAHRPALRAIPHPHPYFAGQGKTMEDYAEYIGPNAAGMIKKLVTA